MRKILARILAFGRFVLFGCAVAGAVFFLFPLTAEAQFIGYTSPQTVLATPLSNANCAGSVASAPSAIPNLGQSFHYINYLITNAGGALPFETRVTLQGSYDGGTFFIISDSATDASSTGGQLVGFGQFAMYRVVVGCLGGSGVNTVTVQYSGTSVSSSLLFTDLDRTIYKKPIFFGAPTNTNRFSNSLIPPYGTTGGVLIFQFLTAGVAGSSVQVLALSDSFVSAQVLATFTLANITSPQFFFLPTLPASSMQINYFSGGASANNYNAEIYFYKPGVAGGDPCGPAQPKSSAVVSVGAAATTQVVALVTNQTIYVCGYQIDEAAAGTIRWVSGTGANCATGTTNRTGAMATLAGEPFTYGPGSTLFKTAVGEALCVTATGVGGTVDGIVTFVQQ